jgi:hypothetical protein
MADGRSREANSKYYKLYSNFVKIVKSKAKEYYKVSFIVLNPDFCYRVINLNEDAGFKAPQKRVVANSKHKVRCSRGISKILNKINNRGSVILKGKFETAHLRNSITKKLSNRIKSIAGSANKTPMLDKG